MSKTWRRDLPLGEHQSGRFKMFVAAQAESSRLYGRRYHSRIEKNPYTGEDERAYYLNRDKPEDISLKTGKPIYPDRRGPLSMLYAKQLPTDYDTVRTKSIQEKTRAELNQRVQEAVREDSRFAELRRSVMKLRAYGYDVNASIYYVRRDGSTFKTTIIDPSKTPVGSKINWSENSATEKARLNKQITRAFNVLHGYRERPAYVNSDKRMLSREEWSALSDKKFALNVQWHEYGKYETKQSQYETRSKSVSINSQTNHSNDTYSKYKTNKAIKKSVERHNKKVQKKKKKGGKK